MHRDPQQLNVRFSFQGPSGKLLSVEGAKTLEDGPRTVNRKSVFFRFDSRSSGSAKEPRSFPQLVRNAELGSRALGGIGCEDLAQTLSQQVRSTSCAAPLLINDGAEVQSYLSKARGGLRRPAIEKGSAHALSTGFPRFDAPEPGHK